MRAKTDIETGAQHDKIVVSEIPYGVNKAELIKSIADLVNEKRIEGISNVNDESDREGMRIVVDIKRDANANVILNQLFKHTQLQDTFGAIMLALVDNQPKVLNILQMLQYYLALAEASESTNADSHAWWAPEPDQIYTPTHVKNIDSKIDAAKKMLSKVSETEKKRMENQIKLWEKAKTDL